MTSLTELEKHDYGAATEWADSKFRGKTVYEGHPIQVIGDALAALPNALRVIKQCKDRLDIIFEIAGTETYLDWQAMQNIQATAKKALAMIADFEQDVTQQEK